MRVTDEDLPSDQIPPFIEGIIAWLSNGVCGLADGTPAVPGDDLSCPKIGGHFQCGDAHWLFDDWS